MRWNRVLTLVVSLLPASVRAQESFKVEPLKEAPPAALAGPVKEALNAEGLRILDDQGKTYADIWYRKATPVAGKPAGPNGPVLFPTLKVGELIGAIRFPEEGRDFRDQAIPQGVYTLRYGLQPMNGDHLGAATRFATSPCSCRQRRTRRWATSPRSPCMSRVPSRPGRPSRHLDDARGAPDGE